MRSVQHAAVFILPIASPARATDASCNAADNALQMSQMEARINAKMDANKIEALQAQINKLQLQQATSGMLRFPTSWSYDAGQFPPVFAAGV